MPKLDPHTVDMIALAVVIVIIVGGPSAMVLACVAEELLQRDLVSWCGGVIGIYRP